VSVVFAVDVYHCEVVILKHFNLLYYCRHGSDAMDYQLGDISSVGTQHWSINDYLY